MAKKRRSGATAIMAVVIMCLVVGWVITLAHYDNVVGEKDDKIEMLKLQAFEAQQEVEELLGEAKDLKDLKESVYNIWLAWRRTRKVELNASNFHKYYVGLKMAPFFRFDEKIWELIKAYNKVFSPYH